MKKYIIGGVIVIIGIIGAARLAAYAQSASFSSGTGSSPVIVTISPRGDVLMRGTIESITDGTLTIKSWGGIWTVKTNLATEVIGPTNTLADFKVGDIAGVRGEMAHDTSFTIDAKTIRAWGHRTDSDKDGLPNDQDNDDDNDGKHDSDDVKPFDHDDDGITDDQDNDDDNDLVNDDTDEDPLDHDNDDIDDAQDANDDDADDGEDADDEADADEDDASSDSDDSVDEDDSSESDSDDDSSGSGNSGSGSSDSDDDDDE